MDWSISRLLINKCFMKLFSFTLSPLPTEGIQFLDLAKISTYRQQQLKNQHLCFGKLLFTPVHFPWEYCTCREDKLHSFSTISQCMWNGNDGCMVVHWVLLHPRMKWDIYSIPDKGNDKTKNKSFWKAKSSSVYVFL